MKKKTEISQETFERIEAYLSNELSETEALKFESRIESDAQFATQVAEVEAFLNAIEVAALKPKLDDYHNEIATKTTSQGGKNYIKYAAAASIILAIALVWLFTKTNPREELYATYYSPDPGLPTIMSATSQFEFYDGMVSYKQGNYEEALSKWQPLVEEKPENDTLSYFMGMAHMATDEITSALPYLNSTIEKTTSTFYSEAIYYKALALVKAAKLNEAIQLLAMHPSDKNQTLLNAIRNLKDE